MARAMRFAKTPTVKNTNRLGDSTPVLAEAPTPARAIPLDLAPLLSPYRRHGRLSLRIERLPRLARLSGGRNNGDNSWSLALDELKGLAYLIPDDMNDAHTLAIRIIGLDSGSTLAVLDFPVSAGAAGPGATLDDCEYELAQARQNAEQAEAEFSAQKMEFDQGKFASLTAGLLVREARPTTPAPSPGISTGPSPHSQPGPEDLRSANPTAAILVRKGEAQPSVPAPSPGISLGQSLHPQPRTESRDTGQAEQNAFSQAEQRAQARLAEARECWQRESEDARTTAEEVWKTDEAARLAAAEARWQEQSATALAARALAEAARDQGNQIELRRLRAELAAVQGTLADRETALVQARLATEQERICWQQESEAPLLKAEKAWKADEFARLAAAKAQWQEQSATALAAASAEAETARDQGNQIELRRLYAELAATQATLADRETALAQARLATEQARIRSQQESEASLSKAEKAWKADETARLAAAKAQWQEQSATALAAASAQVEAVRAQAETARDQDDTSELRRLGAELAAVQATLADRETALAQARSATEQARIRWQQESEASLSKAEKAWKADETARLAAAKAQWQEKSTRALAEARAQVEAARAQADASRDRANEIELRRIAAAEPSREYRAAETRTVLKPDRMRDYKSELERQRKAQVPRHLVRDSVIAACLAASAIVLYPRVEAFIQGPGAIFGNLPAPAGSRAPSLTAGPPGSPVPASSGLAKQRTAVLIHGANVRAGPSGAADVISTLQLGAKVAAVEQRGSWTLIQINQSGDAKPQQGWVYSAFLKGGDGIDIDLPTAKP